MPIPEHRIAICRRCRQPERIAKGAASASDLLQASRAIAAEKGPAVHARLSQCLNCCDGGHTVRVEWRGTEIAVVGIRTVNELETRVLDHLEAIARREIPPALERRIYQVWVDGELIHHKNLSDPLTDDIPTDSTAG
jgi:predicted metal-binding protein